MKTCKDTFAVSKRLCTYFPFFTPRAIPQHQQTNKDFPLFVEFETSLPHLPPFRYYSFNRLTPNNFCSVRTAPLTSKDAFYIFIQQI